MQDYNLQDEPQIEEEQIGTEEFQINFSTRNLLGI